jgi:hypothetical protein
MDERPPLPPQRGANYHLSTPPRNQVHADGRANYHMSTPPRNQVHADGSFTHSPAYQQSTHSLGGTPTHLLPTTLAVGNHPARQWPAPSYTLEDLKSRHPCLQGHRAVFTTKGLQDLYYLATDEAEQSIVMNLLGSSAQSRFEKLHDLRTASQELGACIQSFAEDQDTVADILNKDIQELNKDKQELERQLAQRKKLLDHLPVELKQLTDLHHSGQAFVINCQKRVAPSGKQDLKTDDGQDLETDDGLDLETEDLFVIRAAFSLLAYKDIERLPIASIHGYLDRLHDEGFKTNPWFAENVRYYQQKGTCSNSSIGVQVLRGKTWNETTARGLLALYLRLLPLTPTLELSKKWNGKKQSSHVVAACGAPAATNPVNFDVVTSTNQTAPSGLASHPPVSPFTFGATNETAPTGFLFPASPAPISLAVAAAPAACPSFGSGMEMDSPDMQFCKKRRTE